MVKLDFTKRNLVFFCLFYLIGLNFTFGITYYVSPSGNNNNNGLTVNSPFLTIQRAANVANAGDNVFVLSGTYSEMITINNSGGIGQPITFRALGNVIVKDPCPYVSSCGVWTWGGIFNISNKSHIIIDGFSLEDSWFFGFYINNSSFITIQNNRTNRTGASGIFASGCTNVKILNNLIQRACSHTTANIVIGTQECITLSNTSFFEIAYNEVAISGVSEANFNSSQGGEGINTKGSCTNGTVHDNQVHDLIRLGIYADAWDKTLKNVKIYNNTVWNCREGVALATENGGIIEEIEVYNNVCYNNEQSGIAIVNYGLAPGTKRNISILNNTCYRNGYNRYMFGTSGGGIHIASNTNGNVINNIYVRNNILADNQFWQIRTFSPITANNNLIFEYRGSANELMPNSTDIVDDPLFVDSSTYNFTLQNSSPAINAGIAGPLLDKLGVTRVGSPDIGAYEFVSNLNTNNYVDSLDTLSISPNPSNGFFQIKFDSSNESNVKIFSIEGEILYNQRFDPVDSIQIEFKRKGIFLLSITTANQNVTKKIVIN